LELPTPEHTEALTALSGHRPPPERLAAALAEVGALATSLDALELEDVEPMAGPPREPR
jgi:hypothetical protein